jgi:hypothetical protein
MYLTLELRDVVRRESRNIALREASCACGLVFRTRGAISGSARHGCPSLWVSYRCGYAKGVPSELRGTWRDLGETGGSSLARLKQTRVAIYEFKFLLFRVSIMQAASCLSSFNTNHKSCSCLLTNFSFSIFTTPFDTVHAERCVVAQPS